VAGADLTRTVGLAGQPLPGAARPRRRRVRAGRRSRRSRSNCAEFPARPRLRRAALSAGTWGLPPAAETLRRPPRARGLFNYLGQLDGWRELQDRFVLLREPCGPAIHPGAERRYALEINAGGRRGQLQVGWSFSAGLQPAEHGRRVGGRLSGDAPRPDRSLPVAGSWGCTPADFPLADLDQAALDRLLAACGRDRVEDLYLEPMQQGIALPCAGRARARPLRGRLALTSRRAGAEPSGRPWRRWPRGIPPSVPPSSGRVVTRPLQVVFRQVPLAWQELDWRGLAAAEREWRRWHAPARGTVAAIRSRDVRQLTEAHPGARRRGLLPAPLGAPPGHPGRRSLPLVWREVRGDLRARLAARPPRLAASRPVPRVTSAG